MIKRRLLLLLFSGLKWGKLATTGGTMLLSLVVYAMIWGWPYAAGFIALLFMHEMGHYIAARQRAGLDVGAPTFIPFVWHAWIAAGKRCRTTSRTEAYAGDGRARSSAPLAQCCAIWSAATPIPAC